MDNEVIGNLVRSQGESIVRLIDNIVTARIEQALADRSNQGPETTQLDVIVEAVSKALDAKLQEEDYEDRISRLENLVGDEDVSDIESRLTEVERNTEDLPDFSDLQSDLEEAVSNIGALEDRLDNANVELNI